MEQEAGKSELSRAIRPDQGDREIRPPNVILVDAHFFIDGPGVPNVDHSVLGNAHEEDNLAWLRSWSSLVDFHAIGNELDVGDEVLVTLHYARNGQLLQLDDLLLGYKKLLISDAKI